MAVSPKTLRLRDVGSRRQSVSSATIATSMDSRAHVPRIGRPKNCDCGPTSVQGGAFVNAFVACRNVLVALLIYGLGPDHVFAARNLNPVSADAVAKNL